MSKRVLVLEGLVIAQITSKLGSRVLIGTGGLKFRFIIEYVITLILESFRLIKIKMILRLILNCWIIQILVFVWELLSCSKLIRLRSSYNPWILIGRLTLEVSGWSLRKKLRRVVQSTSRRLFSFNLINLILVMIDVRIQFVELLQKHHALVWNPNLIWPFQVLLIVKLTLRSRLWVVRGLLASQ